MAISNEMDALRIAARQTLTLIGDAEERLRVLREETILLEADIYRNKEIATELASRLSDVATRAGHIAESEASSALKEGLAALDALICERMHLEQERDVPSNVIRLAERFQQRVSSAATTLEPGESALPEEVPEEVQTLREAIQNALASLAPREAKVLRMRFGIDMRMPHTLAEIGMQFDVSRETIRRIQEKALRKLRHPVRSEALRSFLSMVDLKRDRSPETSLLIAIFGQP